MYSHASWSLKVDVEYFHWHFSTIRAGWKWGGGVQRNERADESENEEKKWKEWRGQEKTKDDINISNHV